MLCVLDVPHGAALPRLLQVWDQNGAANRSKAANGGGGIVRLGSRTCTWGSMSLSQKGMALKSRQT